VERVICDDEYPYSVRLIDKLSVVMLSSSVLLPPQLGTRTALGSCTAGAVLHAPAEQLIYGAGHTWPKEPQLLTSV
jgi:hypothetical protein